MSRFSVGQRYVFIRHYFLLNNGIHAHHPLPTSHARMLKDTEVLVLSCTRHIPAPDNSALPDESAYEFQSDSGDLYFNKYPVNVRTGVPNSLRYIVDHADSMDSYVLMDYAEQSIMAEKETGDALEDVQIAVLASIHSLKMTNFTGKGGSL